MSNKIYSSEKDYKYFIGYFDDYIIKPLRIMLQRNTAYIKSYDSQTKWMYFMIEHDNLLEKYNTN